MKERTKKNKQRKLVGADLGDNSSRHWFRKTTLYAIIRVINGKYHLDDYDIGIQRILRKDENPQKEWRRDKVSFLRFLLPVLAPVRTSIYPEKVKSYFLQDTQMADIRTCQEFLKPFGCQTGNCQFWAFSMNFTCCRSRSGSGRRSSKRKIKQK